MKINHILFIFYMAVGWLSVKGIFGKTTDTQKRRLLYTLEINRLKQPILLCIMWAAIISIKTTMHLISIIILVYLHQWRWLGSKDYLVIHITYNIIGCSIQLVLGVYSSCDNSVLVMHLPWESHVPFITSEGKFMLNCLMFD